MAYSRKIRYFPTRRPALLNSDLPLLQASAEYLANEKPRISTKQFKEHFRCYRTLLIFFGENVRLRNIYRNNVDEFVNWRKRCRTSPARVCREVNALCQLSCACYPIEVSISRNPLTYSAKRRSQNVSHNSK